jgi:hypothetical protein
VEVFNKGETGKFYDASLLVDDRTPKKIIFTSFCKTLTVVPYYG